MLMPSVQLKALHTVEWYAGLFFNEIRVVYLSTRLLVYL